MKTIQISTSKQSKNKKSWKVKTMGNITPTMDHYPRNGKMGDTDPQSCMPC